MLVFPDGGRTQTMVQMTGGSATPLSGQCHGSFNRVVKRRRIIGRVPDLFGTEDARAS